MGAVIRIEALGGVKRRGPQAEGEGGAAGRVTAGRGRRRRAGRGLAADGQG